MYKYSSVELSSSFLHISVKVLKIFAETYYSQEVMAQAMDLSYDEAFSFGQAFWNDAETEIELSLVAVDENGNIVICFAILRRL